MLLRRFLLFAVFSLFTGQACAEQTYAQKTVEAARSQIGQTTSYDPAYVSLKYPGGDVPRAVGVCTDVIIRAYRDAHQIDLQKRVHEDMSRSFSSYPNIWGLARPDKNIDHRRVPNLQHYFKRRGHALKVTRNLVNFQPGDVVSWVFPNNLTHIGIVSDRKVNGTQRPMVIHNIGRGTQEEDVLFAWKITGHYRP